MAEVSGVERFGVQEARQRFPELLVLSLIHISEPTRPY